MLKLRALAASVIAACALAACGSSPVNQAATGSHHPAGWGGTPKGYVLPPVLFTAVPSAEMFDTITLSTVPAHPFALAGYTAGFWPTFLPLRRAYPSAHVVSIAIAARYHADCLDVEPRDAVPSQAGPWALADMLAGFTHPCLYSDLSEMPAVKASLAASLGSAWRDKVLLWLAWYRFTPGLVAGYDAVQWSDRALGRNLDESTVSLRFLEIAQPPYLPPVPKPKPKPVPKPQPVPKPKPGPGYNENFQGGFLRGFVVGYDRRHHRRPPALAFTATNRQAFNAGFQAGFGAGWRA